MRIAITAPAAVPPVVGGAERAWAGLRAAFEAAGHTAEIVTLPVPEATLAEVVDGYRRFAALDLSAHDLVVTSKYPAWMVDHPNHVVWMFHPLRGLYDTYHLFGLPEATTSREPAARALAQALDRPPVRGAVAEVLDLFDEAVTGLGADHPDLGHPSALGRALVHWLDAVALQPGAVRRHLALSRTVAMRPGYFPAGVSPRVVWAPSDLPPPSSEATAGPRRHLFTMSRLDGPKRLDLLIDAMAHVPGDVPLLVAGTGPEEEALRARAAHDPRIRFLGRVSDQEAADHYARAVAVPFVPLDEDYGLITVEAFAAGAPVVTTDDSGGVAELVVDGRSGRVVPPTATELGQALADVLADPGAAEAMGAEGRRAARRITWPGVVRAVLGEVPGGPLLQPAAVPAIGPPPPSRPGRSGARALAAAGATTGPRRRAKVVVTTTYAISTPRHGGQLRCFHLYGALARHVDVEVVALVNRPAEAGTTEIAPGFTEVRVPRSPAHLEAGEDLSRQAGLPATDVHDAVGIDATPAYLSTLRMATRDADLVLLAEPYQLPAVERVVPAPVPRLYDAFNVESELKADAYPDTPAGRALLDVVRDLEHRAVTGSAAVTACSEEDAQRLRVLHGVRRGAIHVVPNGTDTRVVVPTCDQRRAHRVRWLRALEAAGGPAAEHVAVFFGSWHPPNLDAAELLLAIAPTLPDVLFVLGGSHGDAFAHRARPANVVFTGAVSDHTRDRLLGLADVAVNPMLAGSGTNLKVIEYLSHGTPTVATPVGVRGIAAHDGVHLRVARPEHLADAIREVLDDPEAAAERAERGRDLAVERYDWQALGDRMAGIICSVLDGPAPGGRPRLPGDGAREPQH